MKKRNNLLQILGVFYLVMALLAIFGIIETSIWGIVVFVVLALVCLYAGAAKLKAEEARQVVVTDEKGNKTVKTAEPQLSSGTLRKMKKERKL